MDASKLQHVNTLCAKITKVAIEEGYKPDFSAFTEGKGSEFRMNVSFAKPTETGNGKQIAIGEEA